MVVRLRFEGIFCQAVVAHCLAIVLGCYSSFVDNSSRKAVSLQRALVGLAAIAGSVLLVLFVGENIAVVRLDDLGYVGQAAVANFYSITVEIFVQLGSLWAVLVDRL